MYFSIALLALATLSCAQQRPPQAFVDTFEDKPRQANSASAANTPVGVENGLLYNGFTVGTDNGGQADGIVTQSQPNFAAGGFMNSPNGTYTITRDYPNSQVTYFDLVEAYYGCSDNTNGGMAEGCVLAATGFFITGQRVSTNAVAFGFPTQSTPTTQPMQRYGFQGLVGLRNVTFGFASVAEGNPNPAFFQFDNVAHVNHYN